MRNDPMKLSDEDRQAVLTRLSKSNDRAARKLPDLIIKRAQRCTENDLSTEETVESVVSMVRDWLEGSAFDVVNYSAQDNDAALREVLMEAMAKAHYQEYMSGVEDLERSWDELPNDHKDRMIRSMQAALKAAPTGCLYPTGERDD
jgi:hypothetical protein